jgi:RNA polymerase sigma-70 factor, ECF subfamily
VSIVGGEAVDVGEEHPNTPSERFGALYAAHYPEIYRYVHRRLATNPEDVPDVVADIFSVAWRRVDEIPRPPEDRLWLYGVAHNLVLHTHRATFRRRRLHMRMSRYEALPVSSSDTSDAVRAAITRLRLQDQELLRLLFWDGLSHAEVAALLDCSVNAVAVRLQKAKRRLRAKLAIQSTSLKD